MKKISGYLYVLKSAEKIFDQLLDVLAFLAGLIFIFMMLVDCCDVVMRYLFKNPLAWVTEICEYLMLYLTFFGAPWLLREGGHVNVDIIFIQLPPKLKTPFKLITCSFGAIACCFLFLYGTECTWDFYSRHMTEIKTLNIQKWILMWVIPFGGLLLSIEFLRQMYQNFASSKSGQEKTLNSRE